MDGPRDCRLDSSRSERQKQTSYVNGDMWDLEKLYRWTYLQSRNRDTVVENRCMEYQWGKEGGINWEIGIDIYAMLY